MPKIRLSLNSTDTPKRQMFHTQLLLTAYLINKTILGKFKQTTPKFHRILNCDKP
jgi:hypothetical protein